MKHNALPVKDSSVSRHGQQLESVDQSVYPKPFQRGDLLCVLLLACAVFLLFKTSPRAGDFWWHDAPRHAMDGIFYYDLARQLPLTHLKHWAMQYYIQYPALGVLFYPPLFAIAEAVFYAMFGLSHSTAQLTVSGFLLANAYGAYFLSRRWLGRLAAFSVALLFLGLPTIAYWGRQVMLEIPAFAFLMWASYAFFRYLHTQTPRFLYLACTLIVASAYTKQSTIFVIPVFLMTLWYFYERDLFRRVEFYGCSALVSLGLVPLAIFTLLWGRLNILQTLGGVWSSYPFLRVCTYVGRKWPMQVGSIVLVLAAVYCVGALLRKQWRLPRPALFFFLAWLIVGYVFFTLIALKEERFTLFLVFPIAIFAVLAIVNLLPAKIGSAAAAALAIGMFVHTLYANPVPYDSGYREMARYVCSLTPENGVIMYSGEQNGSFIFNIRILPDCKNVTVIRADKLLFVGQGPRELFGIKELGITESQFKDLVRRLGVRYVVMEPESWADLTSMRMLVQLLHGDDFKLQSTMPLVSNIEPQRRLELYEVLGPVSGHNGRIRIELPGYGLVVEGEVGADKSRPN